MLSVEQRHVNNVCFAESQRIFPARVSRRAAASCAGVDDAAGGALFAGISRAASETRIFASLQDTRPGGWSFDATLLSGWGGVDYCGFLHFFFRGGRWSAAWNGR